MKQDEFSSLPKEALLQAERSIDFIYGDIPKIGFVTPSVGNSQLGYTLLTKINNFLERSLDTSISIYTFVDEMPIISPLTSIFNILEMRNHCGHLIALDLNTLNLAKIAPRSRVIFYIYDPLLLSLVSKEMVDNILSKDIICISRNRGHRELLKNNFGINTINQLVPNFEIDILKGIIKKYV